MEQDEAICRKTIFYVFCVVSVAPAESDIPSASSTAEHLPL